MSGFFMYVYVQIYQLIKNYFCCFNSEDDVLQLLAGHVDTEKQFKICVTCDDLLQKGFLQWQRQKRFPQSTDLVILSLGRQELTPVALRKMFLTEMIHGIDRKGKSQIYSICDLDNGLYKVVGSVLHKEVQLLVSSETGITSFLSLRTLILSKSHLKI
ncbi:hypothetical protein ATANTOWER_021383 [Ataeniobius toweri]|uniref:Uncharacterized protein n=1 Tax=Ataeniobius toweri TaxID=208326 RepID=A0ABU7C8T0_9TELE|nr:hypothetical protein [Ataeniobius toweri]